ncbi:MAG: hypothetical protein HOP12_06395 [Candidatus Eisenbacteria bacterium]|uniref:Glycosyltransferase RgtA/B/C/D-like domain-containing protein n=1 Tax=Eiseniibacteriota bacterium TaxID=2212470 RepID=A0A849SGW1_UNCEI|nr:hypothetical protein [Candidatus Eisenbacteria bacterium]
MKRIAVRLAALMGLAGMASIPAHPLAELASYPWLGLFPGLVLARVLTPDARGAARLALSLALSPLISGVLACALLAVGVSLGNAALMIALASAAAWLATPETRRIREGFELPRGAVIVASLLAIAVSIPPFLNRYIEVRGDTWTHAAIAMQILARGLPPEDPRFASIPLHYVWFYNLFMAQLVSLRHGDTFHFMSAFNVATAFATVVCTALVAQRLWRGAAATAVAVVTCVGLNAGAWMLWPLHLLKALVGETRDLADVRQQLATLRLGDDRIIYSLSAPYSHMVSFLDKLMLGSPLAFGYLMMLVHLSGIVSWVTTGDRRALTLAFAGATGTMLFHGVVGLSVIPVWCVTLSLALAIHQWVPSARRALPAPRRLMPALSVTLAAGLLTTPYLLSVASGWAAESSGLRHRYLQISPMMLWTFATAGAVVWIAIWKPIREAWATAHPARTLVSLAWFMMTVFALVVHLPENNEMKFVFQAFVLGVLLAAPAIGEWAWGANATPRRRITLATLALVPVVLTFYGYLSDPRGRTDPVVTEPPGALAMAEWIRDHTPPDAMVLDAGFRDALMVKSARVLYLGTSFGPERAAFPLDQVRERRAVAADLYGAAPNADASLSALARFDRPLYVVYRPEDDSLTTKGWRALTARPRRVETVFERDGYRVLRVRLPREGS